MIVNDLHLLWSSIRPHETDAPLVIDPDAVLTGAISFQRFEPISWRHPEIIQRLGGSHLTQLTQRHHVDPRIERRRALTTPQTLGFFAPERSDHTTRI